MPTFTFTAKDDQGRLFSSTLEGPDKKAVRDDLRRMRYQIKSLKVQRERTPRKGRGKARKSDMIVFTRQLATMVGAGVPFHNALGLICEETENLQMKEVIRDMQTQIGGGMSLHDACARHPKIFSDFFTGMVGSSEKGGSLDIVLEQVALHLEKQEELRQKVVQAFAYPIVVVVLCSLVMTFLVAFIVPVFAEAYGKMGVALPGPTQALIMLSDFMRDYWWALLGGLAAGIVFWIRYRKTEQGARTIGELKLKAPLFGPIIRKIATARFLKNFAVMLKCRIPIQESLVIAEEIAKNPVISTASATIRDGVRAGKPLVEPLKQCGAFPPMVVGMASAGESSGTVPEMIEKAAEYLEQEIEAALKKMLVKLEPIMTVGLAGLVGFILLAVYLPMFDVMKSAG